MLLGSLVGVLLTGFIFVGVSNAHSFRTGDNITVSQGERIDDTLFVAGRNIDINSTVIGDIFCAGQTITISGNVEGDVICAGQTVRVSGKVDGDVRLAGQTVSISADVGGNATVAAQTFTLDSEGSVGRDLSVGSQDSAINGQVGRDLAVGSGSVVVDGGIGRDIKGNVADIRLGSSAKVGGNIDYTSANDIQRDNGSQVSGTVTRTDPPKNESSSKNGAIFGFGIGWFLYWLAAMLIVAMVLVLLLPRMFMRLSDRAMPRPWKALLTGLVAGLVAPVVIVILLMSVIGIPLAIIAGLAWLLVVFLSGPVTAFYIGRLVVKDTNNALLYMLVGAIILLVLYFIPILGFLALLFAFWTGTGMILLEIFGKTPRPAYATDAPKVTNARSKSNTSK